MKYDRNELKNKNVHSLRIIARKIGVKSPTTLKKEQLIEQIGLISDGKISPYFSNRGRPSLSEISEQKSKEKQSLKEKQKQLNALFSEMKKRVNEIITK